MDLSKLETLKDKLVHGKRFADTFEYFLDHFAEDQEFLELGGRGQCPMLDAILPEAGRQMLGKQVQLRGLLLTYLPEHGFFHGAGFLNEFVANVFYFESIHQGLLAVAVSGRETKFARFQGIPMPRGWKPPSGAPSNN